MFTRSVCFLLFAATVGALAQDFDQPVGSPLAPKVDLRHVRIEQRLGNRIPEQATFYDRMGRAVRLLNYLHSKPLLVLPIFYRCTGVCGLELQSLLGVLPKIPEGVGRDFDVVVLSIDPKEGPDLARGKCTSIFASQPALKGTEGGWHFLTGNLNSIRSLTDALGFYFTFDAQNDLINHPSGMMIITPDGVISSYMLGANYAPATLSANIELARKSQVGKKATDVFFGCIHIDPVTGKRSLIVEGVLRLAGLATVFGIVSTIGVLSFRRRLAKT